MDVEMGAELIEEANLPGCVYEWFIERQTQREEADLIEVFSKWHYEQHVRVTLINHFK